MGKVRKVAPLSIKDCHIIKGSQRGGFSEVFGPMCLIGIVFNIQL